MEKVILAEEIGEFFSKMYNAHKGRDVEVNLIMSENKIQIYNRESFSFTDVKIIEKKPTLDGLVKSLISEKHGDEF
jgi:hypothetical protein